ncbi:hypothetical protein ACYULU_07150 [Breznakiellaceae bacterium SP9]
MANTRDYIPTRDADFDGWFENLSTFVVEKTSGGSPAWTHIPAEKVSALTAQYTLWHTAYQKTIAPHTPADTQAKNDAKKMAVKFVRPFVAQYLMFPPVTDEYRTAMRLHNRDTTHSTIATPTSRPLITGIKSLGGFQVEIRFQDEATPDRKAIPYGFNGCLLHYVWGAERVSEYAALVQGCLMTRSTWVLSLPPEAERTYLSCAAQWQNEKGELGPWGDIQTVVVA